MIKNEREKEREQDREREREKEREACHIGSIYFINSLLVTQSNSTILDGTVAHSQLVRVVSQLMNRSDDRITKLQFCNSPRKMNKDD